MAKIEVKAECAGTVISVAVNTGQDISRDDEILVLEAMKMEIPVVCTLSGVVTTLRVAAGDTLQEGDVVAVIETDS